VQRTCPACYQHPGADGGYHEYCQNLAQSVQEQRQTGCYFLSVGSVTFINHNLISCQSTNYCSCTGQQTTNRRSNTEEFLKSGQCLTSHGTRRFISFFTRIHLCLILNQVHSVTHSQHIPLKVIVPIST